MSGDDALIRRIRQDLSDHEIENRRAMRAKGASYEMRAVNDLAEVAAQAAREHYADVIAAADEMAGSLGCRCVKGWGTNEPRPATYSVCAPCRYRAARDERG